VVERVQARDNSPCAVTKKKDRQVRFARLPDSHDRLDVTDVVLEGFDIEALAFRVAATAQIYGIYAKAICDELLRNPLVVPAVRVEARNDDDECTRLSGRTPGSEGDLQTAYAIDCFLICGS
jgi:hypothetical protein